MSQGPHQRPSGGRELAGMRKLAKRLRRVARSSKFGIARERCSTVVKCANKAFLHSIELKIAGLKQNVTE